MFADSRLPARYPLEHPVAPKQAKPEDGMTGVDARVLRFALSKIILGGVLFQRLWFPTLDLLEVKDPKPPPIEGAVAEEAFAFD